MEERLERLISAVLKASIGPLVVLVVLFPLNYLGLIDLGGYSWVMPFALVQLLLIAGVCYAFKTSKYIAKYLTGLLLALYFIVVGMGLAGIYVDAVLTITALFSLATLSVIQGYSEEKEIGYRVIVPALVGVFVLFLVFQIPNLYRGFLGADPSISRLVAEQIAEGKGHVTPSGTPYSRGYLFHELLALVISFLGPQKYFLRGLAVSISLISVGMAFMIGKRVAGREAGVISAFLFVSSGFLRRYTSFPRLYPSLIALFLTSIYLVLEYERTDDYRYLLGGFAASLLSIGFHRLGIIGVGITGLLLLRFIYLNWGGFDKYQKLSLTLVFILAAIVWNYISRVTHESLNLSLNLYPLNYFLNNYTFLFLAALAGIIVVSIRQIRKGRASFPLIFLVGVASYSAVYNYFPNRNRYLVLYVPLIIIAAVAFLNDAGEIFQINKNVVRIIMVSAAILLLVVSPNFSINFSFGNEGESSFDFVRKNADKDTVVIGHSGQRILVNAGKLDYWLMPEYKRRAKYSVGGEGEVHKYTNRTIISNLEELRRVEKNNSQIFVLWGSYRKRAVLEMVRYVTRNYFYYPDVEGYELFTKKPVKGYRFCRAKVVSPYSNKRPPCASKVAVWKGD